MTAFVDLRVLLIDLQVKSKLLRAHLHPEMHFISLTDISQGLL